MELRPGTALSEHLRLVRPLAQGAMGWVWVASDARLGAEVAVKLISTRLSGRQPEALARFKREADAAIRLRSPHVVRTYDHGHTEDGLPYLVMELLEGETLGQHLARVSLLTPAETAQIVHQVAGALTEAHAAGIVHRDIKPDNIYLVDHPRPPYAKVLDFGTAKQTLTREESLVTATGVMVGTPEYMSPEQVLGSRDVDHRADLWGLAVVAYQALTGLVPFGGPNPQSLCLNICMGRFEPASTVLEGLSADLDPWFERALAPNPNNRFDSAEQMSAALSRIVLPDGAILVEEVFAVDDADVYDDSVIHEEETHAMARGHLAALSFDVDDDLTRPAGDAWPEQVDDEAQTHQAIEVRHRSAALDGQDAPGSFDAESSTNRLARNRARARDETSTDPAPRPPPHAEAESDDEPTSAYHKDVLREASGADGEPELHTPRPPAQPKSPWLRVATAVALLAVAAGAVSYGTGLLEPSRLWTSGRTTEASGDGPSPGTDGVPAASDGVSGLSSAPESADGGEASSLVGTPSGRDSTWGGAAGAGGLSEEMRSDGGGDATATASGAEPAGLPGYVTIICIPQCDQVIALGRALGPSPVIRARLPAGDQQLTLKRGGQPEKVVSVRVVSDQLITRRISMAPSARR